MFVNFSSKNDKQDMSIFINQEIKKQRREICEKKDNEHTIHKKKKNERHYKNKINFENVKLCNVTVLSCVMCVSCVVLPQTSLRYTHKAPLRSNQ